MPGTEGTPIGWILSEVFFKWMHFFVEYILYTLIKNLVVGQSWKSNIILLLKTRVEIKLLS